MGAKIDITGHRYGKLVVKYAASNEGEDTRWICQCDCGSQIIRRTSFLRHGHTTSCGCGRKTHRDTNSPTYKTWKRLRERCLLKSNPSYRHYGGRGITVSESWMTYANFLADMGKKPAGTSLDRIDNNLGYFKGNCRWASVTEQQRNKRTTIMIEHNGETLPLRTWCERVELPYHIVWQRIKNSKWSVDKALTTPVLPRFGILPA